MQKLKLKTFPLCCRRSLADLNCFWQSLQVLLR